MTLPEGRFVLFIRHADRPPIPPDDPYADVSITSDGAREVASLAYALRGRISWTSASPYARCQITAQGLGATPQTDTRLGKSGPWIESRDLAVPEFNARGSMGVVRAQVAGVKLPGMRPPEQAVPILLSAGLEHVGAGSGICVSHYSILMPAMAWLFGPDTADEQLAPLSGFALELRSGTVLVSWNGRERLWPLV